MLKFPDHLYTITVSINILLILFELENVSTIPSDFTSDTKCEDGQQQIEMDKKCDGVIDCTDKSDETETCKSYECPSYAYRCRYGGCIDGGRECDGKQDCADNSDETHCARDHQNWRGNCTSTDEYQCRTGECIQKDKLCDGVKNCQDESDERNCTFTFCPSFSFRCAYGACIPDDLKCNHHKDCIDGSDEWNTICGDNHEITSTTQPTDTIWAPTDPPPASCYISNIPENLQISYEGSPSSQLHSGDYVDEYAAIFYTCINRFKLIGNSAAYCINGTLTNNETPYCVPTCSNIRLHDITINPICEYKGQTIPCRSVLQAGTIAKLSCRTGYKKRHNRTIDTIHCNTNGNWDHLPFNCLPTCGTQAPVITDRIVSGNPTNHTLVPWHVGIYSNIQSSQTFEQICGGTILTAKLIITAAHCFWDSTENKMFNETHFKIGTLKYFRAFDAKESMESKFIQVDEIVHKEEYNHKEGLFGADIAILVLQELIKLTEFIKPICIHTNLNYTQKIIRSDWTGRVAGWGIESSGGEPSPVLKVIDLPTVNYATCKTEIPEKFRKYLTVDKFCAGFINENQSVCQGDSGGGLVFPEGLNELGERVYYLRGIVSTGDSVNGKCNSDTYATFTNVQTYIEWIENLMTMHGS